METLIGIVDNILYEATDTTFKVFTLIQKNKAKIKICGNFDSLIKNAWIEIVGEYRTHYKYGTSFYATSYNYTHDNSTNGLYNYLQAIAKWLGPIKTKALIEHFGISLEEIIEKDYLKLTEVDGIGEKIALSIKEAWEENKKSKDVKIFLYSLGLSDLKVKKILSYFGLEAEKKIKENPWCLSEIYGISFSTCDSFAIRLNKELDDINRYFYFIIEFLRGIKEQGDLYATPTELIVSFEKYNKKSLYPFKDISVKKISEVLDSLIKNKKIIFDNNKIYLTSSFYFENESAVMINKIKNTNFRHTLDDLSAKEFIKEFEEKNKIKLAEEQKKAIELFLKEKILIITGPPGTGKTTILKIIVQILNKKGINFSLLCPTGMAAKRLSYLADYPAYTIHKFLGFKNNDWTFNKDNKANIDVAIIDETSMLDQEVFYRLISALELTTKIVLVGDVDQLPSVGPGNVLKDLINSSQFPVIFLNTIFRQGKYSSIVIQAKKIKDGITDMSLFASSLEAELCFMKNSNLDEIQNYIIEIVTQLKSIAKEKKLSFQIITPRNDGPLSVRTLNKTLQDILNPASEEKKQIDIGHETIRVGDRIVIKKNNYALDIFNGDIAKVVDITSDIVSIYIENKFEQRLVNIPITIVEETVKLAYALTVHKCQGMEYDIVIMPLVKEHGNLLLQRNLLYTALTRAKKKFILIGSKTAFELAIINDQIQRRNTYLSERIQKWKENSETSTQDLLCRYYNIQKENIESLQLSL